VLSLLLDRLFTMEERVAAVRLGISDREKSGATLDVGLRWNALTNKWRCVAAS